MIISYLICALPGRQAEERKTKFEIIFFLSSISWSYNGLEGILVVHSLRSQFKWADEIIYQIWVDEKFRSIIVGG